MGSPFLSSGKCGALLETQLLHSLASISRNAKASLGRVRTEVHRTSWLLGTLKHPSVVSAQRSTGPLDTHLAQHTGVTIIYFCISNIFDWFMNFVRDYFLFILYNEFYMGCVLLVNSR